MLSSRQVGKELEDLTKRQKKLQAQIAKQTKVVSKNQFRKDAVAELERLEKAEVELAAEYLTKYKSFVLSSQNDRRNQLEHAYRSTSASKKKAPHHHHNRGDGDGGNGDTLFSSTQQDHIELLEERTAALEGRSKRQAASTSNARTAPPPPRPSKPAPSAPPHSPLGHDLTTWELTKDEIQIDDERLGTGSFGTVMKGRLRGKVVAVKLIPISWPEKMDQKTQAILEDFRNECAVMSKMLHPNVLLWMGMCMDRSAKELYMVTEYMPNGSVFDLLHKGKKQPSFAMRMKWAKDCALGLNHLHLSRPPILHLDLKSQNMLVDAHYQVKVADFGLSKVLGPSGLRGAAGSPVYMAPEVLNEQPYDSKADVYSFGVLLNELVTCQIPYIDHRLGGGTQGLVKLFQLVNNGGRPTAPKPEACPPKFLQLIQRCWDGNPRNRPTFQEIIDSHVFDDAIIDKTFSDANLLGREFWAQNFSKRDGLEESVDWSTFIKSLVKFCDVVPEFGQIDVADDVRIKCLRAVLVLSEEKVTLERFAAVLEWFGPLTLDDSFLENLRDTVKIKGFWGDVSSDQVTNLMAGARQGSYAIRFSGQQAGYFTITGLTTKGVENWRIQHSAGGPFIIGDQEFPTLRMLIKEMKESLGISKPLAGSKYSKLFLEHEEKRESEYVDLTKRN